MCGCHTDCTSSYRRSSRSFYFESWGPSCLHRNKLWARPSQIDPEVQPYASNSNFWSWSWGNIHSVLQVLWLGQVAIVFEYVACSVWLTSCRYKKLQKEVGKLLVPLQRPLSEPSHVQWTQGPEQNMWPTHSWRRRPQCGQNGHHGCFSSFYLRLWAGKC